jgi:hypothetical protein
MHEVPKSFGNKLQSHLPQVIRGEWMQDIFHEYRDIFGGFEYTVVSKKGQIRQIPVQRSPILWNTQENQAQQE